MAVAVVTDELRALALTVHERLCREYKCPIPYFHSLDPLSELVSSLLSHRTKNKDSGRAFKTLRAKYPTWVEVMNAPVDAVAGSDFGRNVARTKAPRIQEALRMIYIKRDGQMSLEFLRDMPPTDARDWLEEIPGVGPKTSAAVLIFSTLRIPFLPVDCHHHRVAARLGLIPKKMAVGPSHEFLAAELPRDWDAQHVYDNHEILMIHGQRVCYFEKPACHRCVLLDLCPEGQKRMAERAQPSSEQVPPPA